MAPGRRGGPGRPLGPLRRAAATPERVPWLAVALLLALTPPWPAVRAASCEVLHALASDGSLLRGSLEPGCTAAFLVVPGPGACASGSWLSVEAWDLEVLGAGRPAWRTGGGGGAAAQAPVADPLLGLARGVQPRASFVPPSSWSLTPAAAAFDRAGYQLARPYMQVRARPLRPRGAPPLERGRRRSVWGALLACAGDAVGAGGRGAAALASRHAVFLAGHALAVLCHSPERSVSCAPRPRGPAAQVVVPYNLSTDAGMTPAVTLLSPAAAGSNATCPPGGCWVASLENVRAFMQHRLSYQARRAPQDTSAPVTPSTSGRGECDACSVVAVLCSRAKAATLSLDCR
jgi:hypothetical protein